MEVIGTHLSGKEYPMLVLSWAAGAGKDGVGTGERVLQSCGYGKHPGQPHGSSLLWHAWISEGVLNYLDLVHSFDK